MLKMEYREFVKAGLGGENIWEEVRGQSILGEEDFAETLLDYVKGYREIEDIPKMQRYVDRPGLSDIFNDRVLSSRKRRNEMIIKAVERYGYSQREVANHLGMHYASISRLASSKQGMLTYKT